MSRRPWSGQSFPEVRSHLATLVEERVPLKPSVRDLLRKDGCEMMKKARSVENIYDFTTRDDELVVYGSQSQVAYVLVQLRQYLSLFQEETVPVPYHAIGRIIGKGGTTIDRIKAIEGMEIVNVEKNEGSVLLFGKSDGVAAAKAMVQPRGARRVVRARASMM